MVMAQVLEDREQRLTIVSLEAKYPYIVTLANVRNSRFKK